MPQSPKVLKRLPHTADQRGGITAFDKDRKAHARVAEDCGEPVEVTSHSVLLILKIPPIELDLFSWFRFIPHDWNLSSSGRTQRVNKGFEDAAPLPV